MNKKPGMILVALILAGSCPLASPVHLRATLNESPEITDAPRISIKLVESDVRDALRLVAKQGGVNIVMSPDVTGEITLELQNVSLRETLDAIANVGGFEYTLDGNIVTVSTLKELIEHERQRAEFAGEPEPEPSTTAAREALVLKLRYVDAERLLGVVEKLLGEGGTVTLLNTTDHLAQIRRTQIRKTPKTTAGAPSLQIGTQLATTTRGRPAKSHTLVVVDRPERLAEISRIVNRIDQKPVQVLIEARFVEVTLGDVNRLGIDWNVVFGASGAAAPHTFPLGDSSLGAFNPNVTGGSPSGVFPNAPSTVTTPGAVAGLFTFGTLDFSTFAAVLEMIQTDSRVEVVSNPHIVVGDRHTATILVGERYPILSANVSEFGTVTEQLDRYEPIGVQLEVSPSVLNDSEIELFVRPSTSSLGALVTGSTGLSVARINSRQIDTSVTVKDGQTVVLGGLITKREVEQTSSVPFLGAIPILGRLFTHESTSVERVDLVVFLSVTILRDSELTDEQREMFEKTSLGKESSGQPKTAAAPRSPESPRSGEQPLRYSLSAPRY